MTLLKDNTQDHEEKWPQCKETNHHLYHQIPRLLPRPYTEIGVESPYFILLFIFSWVGPVSPTLSVVVQDHNFFLSCFHWLDSVST